MAKQNMINRENKRSKLVLKFKDKRDTLREQSRDKALSYDERFAAAVALQKLPRDSSPVRQRTRCELTGRPRGVYKKFGLGRNKLREAAMRGEIPGLTKASW